MSQSSGNWANLAASLACAAALGCGARSTLDDTAEGALARPVPAGCWTASDELLILSPEELRIVNVRTRRSRSVGDVPCADEAFNSMAVSQSGTVYVGLESGRLIELQPGLDCRTASATWTQQALPDYGMTFLGPAESELLVMAEPNGTNSVRLLTLDPRKWSTVHDSTVRLSETSPHLELAGSPQGELYAYGVGNYRYPKVLLEIEVQSGVVLDRLELGPGIGLASFAAARLDDAIYTFTAPAAREEATMHATNLVTRQTTELGTLPFPVVGAGVPGCVPHP